MINYNLTKIQALMFDVDGVLSRQTITLHPTQGPMRTVNIKDGYALQHAVRNGLLVAIITGADTPSLLARYHGLGITEVHLSASHKINIYNALLQKYDLSDDQVLYMGDDIPDYTIMRRVGLPCCPADAAYEIKTLATYISPCEGGEGCVRDVIQQVMKAQNKWMHNEDAFGW